MSEFDPFALLVADEELAQSLDDARESLGRVHRRPAALRKFEVISSESLLRGARASVALDGGEFIRAVDGGVSDLGASGGAISAYSVLAPERMNTTARTFTRAPLQVLARLAVLAGGEATPADPARVQALAGLIAPRGGGSPAGDMLAAVVHAEIAAHALFGRESGTVARAAARIAAVTSGFDPRGFGVPETYLFRHRNAYRDELAAYAGGEPLPLLRLIVRAWAAGADEADGIAQAV